MKNKKARIALAMVLIALYAFTGWLQRGWVDWLGVATVALLIETMCALSSIETVMALAKKEKDLPKQTQFK